MELKDFARIRIEAGETKTVRFKITPAKLQYLDLYLNQAIPTLW